MPPVESTHPPQRKRDLPRVAAPRMTPRATMRVRITPAGWLFLLVIPVTGIIAVQPSGNLLVILLGMFIGAFLLNLFGGWSSLRRIQVKRILPDSGIAGAPGTIRYVIQNRRRWARCHGIVIKDHYVNQSSDEQSAVTAFAPVVRGRQRVTLSVPVVWHNRGELQFGKLEVSTDFPFGLCKKTLTIESNESFTVLPELGKLRVPIWDFVRRNEASHAGSSAARTTGDEEFFGLRQYRPGDNPKRIHWRRSARTGELFVREMARPQTRQLFCVLSTRCNPNDIDELHRLEAAISCAATIVCDVLETSGKIALITSGKPAMAVPPGSGRALRVNLLRDLARQQSTRDEPVHGFLERLPWSTYGRGPCFLIGPTMTDELRRAAWWLGRRVGPVTTLIPHTATFDSLFMTRTSHISAWEDFVPLVSESGDEAWEDVVA